MTKIGIYHTHTHIPYVWLMLGTKWFAKGLAKKREKYNDICWELKPIGLLLHMHNTRHILHSYSSTVEILED
jgi:hypothetical protein